MTQLEIQKNNTVYRNISVFVANLLEFFTGVNFLRRYPLCMGFFLLLGISYGQVEFTTGGTGSAYTLAIPGTFVLRDGLEINFKAHTACASGATLNVSGTGNVSITKNGNLNTLSAGDIQQNQIVKVVYSNGKWHMLSVFGNTSGFLPFGINGQTLRHDGTDWLANSFLFNDGSKVAVGTTSPPTLMSISSSFAPIYSTILSSSATTNSTVLGGIYFADSQLPGTAQAGIYGYRDAASSTSTDLPTRLSFFTTADGSNSTTEKVRIDNSGNVGIGANITGGVAARLSVDDNTANKMVAQIHNETGTTSTGTITGSLGLKIGISSDGTEQKTGLYTVVTGSGTGIQMGVYGSAIGSSTGSYNRGIVGSASNNTVSNIGGDFFATGNTGDNYALRANVAGTQTNTKYGLYLTSSGSGTKFGLYLSGEDKNYLSGKLGIGTATPNEALQVSGNVQISGAFMPNGLSGNSGEVLTSQGAGSPPLWKSLANAGILSGTGTNNYNARWLGSTILGIGSFLDDGINVYPATNNSPDLGTSTNNWNDFYLGGRLYVSNLPWTGGNSTNTFIGLKMNEALTSGLYNLGVGQGSGKAITTGNRNTAVGHRAGENFSTGSDNTMIGSLAGGLGSPGSNNTFLGSYAGYGASNTASDNTFVGAMVGGSNTTGTSNTSVGTNSAYNNTTGTNNTLVGTNSAFNNTTGNSNSAFGRNALISNTTGSNNTALGYNADVGSGALTNATAIGANTIVSQSNSLILGNNADVGIGTSTPLARLNVAEGLAYSLLGTNPVSAQIVVGTNANQRLYLGSYYTAGVGAASMIQSADFYSSVDNPSNLSIQPIGGNVGIGISNPASKLHIAGGDISTDWDFQMSHNQSSWGANAVRAFLNKQWNGTVGDFMYLGSTGNNSNTVQSAIMLTGTAGILFGRGTDGGIGLSSEFARINTSGNLGIGITGPTSRLHAAHSTTNPVIQADNNFSGNNDAYGLWAGSVNNPGFGIGVYGTGGYKGVEGFANGTSYTGGTFGVIGNSTGTAGSRYGVYGSASGGTTNYGVYCVGTGAYTTSWIQASDSKFKENVKPLSGTLQKVLQLEPKTYNLKSKEYSFMGFSDQLQIGLIAQEVEKVFPELVEDAVHPGPTNPETGRLTGEEMHFKAMNYIGLTPVLVQAIKEQQLQIEELKKQLEEQKRRIQQLENK